MDTIWQKKWLYQKNTKFSVKLKKKALTVIFFNFLWHKWEKIFFKYHLFWKTMYSMTIVLGGKFQRYIQKYVTVIVVLYLIGFQQFLRILPDEMARNNPFLNLNKIRKGYCPIINLKTFGLSTQHLLRTQTTDTAHHTPISIIYMLNQQFVWIISSIDFHCWCVFDLGPVLIPMKNRCSCLLLKSFVFCKFATTFFFVIDIFESCN